MARLSVRFSSSAGDYQVAFLGIRTILVPNKGVLENPNLIKLCLLNCRVYKSDNQKAEIGRVSICMFVCLFMNKIKYLFVFVTLLSPFFWDIVTLCKFFLETEGKPFLHVMSWIVFLILSFDLWLDCDVVWLGDRTQWEVVRPWGWNEWFDIITAPMASYWRGRLASFCPLLSFPHPSTVWVRMQ